MSDPEEWVNFEDRENEQWEYELRVRELLSCLYPFILTVHFIQPCGERVLMTLCHQYNDYVVPLLETTFKQLVGRFTGTRRGCAIISKFVSRPTHS